MKAIQIKGITLLGITACVLSTASPTLAKLRTATLPKPKSVEVHFIKGITGEATLTLQRSLQATEENASFQFQDGKLADNVEFYKSPRCYLHFRKALQKGQELPAGIVLKVSKIDNIYQNGSVHVTFFFDRDQTMSDLSCITNYDHTLRAEELKSTLGTAFQISLTKSIEKDALFNTAPSKTSRVLSEDSSANNMPIHSARVILSDS